MSKPCDAVSSFFSKTTSQLSSVVSSPIAGPLAAWIPPPSPHGRVDGVSRERGGHRALDQA
ncbi:hypothetical protein XspCFBP7912_21455 [Xanthomonas sp. CFBP 7912]|nr:hypothetical protein XspCFBP7912_21455 [Xanthomonas sp. CFBP 7912]